MILGQYVGRLEEKHRIAFPKKFRQSLGTRLIITKGIDKNLIVISAKDEAVLLEGTEGKPFIDRETRQIQRYLFGNAQYATLDKQGRFLLADYLRIYAGLEKEVIFVGVRQYVEIWDKKLWEEQQNKLSEKIIDISERVTKKDAE